VCRSITVTLLYVPPGGVGQPVPKTELLLQAGPAAALQEQARTRACSLRYSHRWSLVVVAPALLYLRGSCLLYYLLYVNPWVLPAVLPAVRHCWPPCTTDSYPFVRHLDRFARSSVWHIYASSGQTAVKHRLILMDLVNPCSPGSPADLVNPAYLRYIWYPWVGYPCGTHRWPYMVRTLASTCTGHVH